MFNSDFSEELAMMGEILSDREKAAIGMIKKDRGYDKKSIDRSTALMESAGMLGYQGGPQVGLVSLGGMRTMKPYHGKESDAEIMFNFEDWEDAQDLYDFIIESGLLVPGEIRLEHTEGQNSVHFAPHVLVMKPDVIHAAMIAYQDVVLEDSADVFNEISEGIGMVLQERIAISGAPKRRRGEGNPFHDKRTGKFSGAANATAWKGGSWALGKTKLKYTGAKKSKNGDLVVNYGSTKHPCGRAAREQGKDIRCWDGQEGAGFRIAKVFGKKQRRESYDQQDGMIMSEVREYFASLLRG